MIDGDTEDTEDPENTEDTVGRRDEERFHAYGSALADAVEEALPGWVRRSVERFLRPGGTALDPAVDASITEAGRAAVAEVGKRLRDLLARDVDDQWTNPLSILRSAAAYPTTILTANGVPPVERDRHARRINPDDVYDLGPATFAELSDEVHDQGIRWGAAKAHVHLQRRKGS